MSLLPMTALSADHVLAEKGRTFHWARRLLGAIHAARATRLYRLCRYIDDMADEAVSVDAAKAGLEQIAHDIFSGQSADPIITDGLALMRECQIDPAILLELVKGVASDLAFVRIHDEDALMRYCFRVAGTVGLMMCGVLDASDPAALPHAVDLGIAMQLTNICRDISADALAGRRYVPQTMLGALSAQALVDPQPEIQVVLKQCVKVLLDRADVYYRSGELGLSYLPLGARSGILAAARNYRAIGSQLRQRDFAYWEGRAVVLRRTKLVVTAHALLTVPLQSSFWLRPRRHDSHLHAALNGLLCLGAVSSASPRSDHAV